MQTSSSSLCYSHILSSSALFFASLFSLLLFPLQHFIFLSKQLFSFQRLAFPFLIFALFPYITTVKQNLHSQSYAARNQTNHCEHYSVVAVRASPFEECWL